MKLFSILMCALFVVGMVPGQVTPLLAGDSKHDLSAEVVSVDVEGKNITVKVTEGNEITMPVMGDAVETLEKLTAGDKVILTCEDEENGEHKGIVSIDTGKAPEGEG
jgi:hypothetical protein